MGEALGGGQGREARELPLLHGPRLVLSRGYGGAQPPDFQHQVSALPLAAGPSDLSGYDVLVGDVGPLQVHL